jgi:hypothetical protein
MTRRFSELREKMSPEARTESNRLFEETLKGYPLAEFRETQGLSQQTSADYPLAAMRKTALLVSVQRCDLSQSVVEVELGRTI